MKSNIQLKYSNYVAFSHVHGYAVNNLGLFYAIEYLSGALETDPLIRKEIREELEKYLPPQYMDCEQISRAGNLAVPYLEYKDYYTEVEKCTCIYTLSLIGTREALRAIKGYFVEPLGNERLRIIGNMLNTYRYEDIVEEEIPKLICDYLMAREGEEVVISNGLIRVLSYLDDNEKKLLERMNMEDLFILDYDDENEHTLPGRLYKKVQKLTIDGDFESLSILNKFNNLKSLTVVARGEMFDLYCLNSYRPIYRIEKFQLVLYKRGYVYISGQDMEYLDNCQSLSLTFLGNQVELDLSDFRKLKKLRYLDVSAEYALDFDHSLLENIESLTINYPTYIEGEIPDELEKLSFKVECGKFNAHEY